MPHKIVVKDTVSGLCGLADPPAAASTVVAGTGGVTVVPGGTPAAPTYTVNVPPAVAAPTVVAGTGGVTVVPGGTPAAPTYTVNVPPAVAGTAVAVTSPLVNTGTPTAPILDIDFCNLSAADFACLRSADATNMVAAGADNKLFVPPELVTSATQPAPATNQAPKLWRNSSGGTIGCIPSGGVAFMDSAGTHLLNQVGRFEAYQAAVQPVVPSFTIINMVMSYTESVAWFGTWNGTDTFTFTCPGTYILDASVGFYLTNIAVDETFQVFYFPTHNGQGLFVENEADTNKNGTVAAGFAQFSGSKTITAIAGDTVQVKIYSGNTITSATETIVGRRSGLAITRIGD
jgi:hypothetical protein